jgi:hypothetical protein
MFNPEERESLRVALLDRARTDRRISGGAITGSGSLGALDRWSDVDVAFGVRDAHELEATLDDFTRYMRDDYGAVDTLDVRREPWLYRVFLLPNTLQVDLAFVPASDFGALAATFRLVFGEAKDVPLPQPPDSRDLIGYSWLYAIHARSAIMRDHLWQALYMVEAMRDRIMTLACLRVGLPTRDGRGYDELPESMRRALEPAIVQRLTSSALKGAFAAVVEVQLSEIRAVDAEKAAVLEPILRALVATACGKDAA